MKNKKALIGMAVLFLAIGFATISTTLIVNGILALGESDDFEIIFTSAKLDGRKRNDFISSDKKHIEFTSNTLTDIDDETKLVYEVTNTSRNYDANVSVRCTSGENEYIMFNYTPLEMKVLAGETKSGSLTASMLKVSDIERDIPIECTLIAEATERESLGDEYIEPFSRSGVLMAVPTNTASDQKYWAYKSNITKVIFEDKIISHKTDENLIFDVSSAQDKSVLAYLVQNEETLTNLDNLEDTTAYTLYIQSDSGVKSNPNSSYLFQNFNNLVIIEGMNKFDTSLSTNMRSMFENCKSLESIDLSNFNTVLVNSMAYMFSNCKNLKTADFQNFDTSNVTNIARMFAMTGFINLDLSSFDTSNVTDMNGMFNEARQLVTLDVSSFDTSKSGSFYFMFRQCNSLKELDLNNFDVSNITNFGYAFESCYSLTKLNCGKWRFSEEKAVDMYYMFAGCVRLESLDVSNWNMSSVRRTDYMFWRCEKLRFLDTSKWSFEKNELMSGMFQACRSLEYLDVSNFDTTNVRTMYSMFRQCDNLANLDVSRWNTSNLTNMSFMFAYCGNLESLDVSNWNTSNVTDMSSMFGYLRKVETLDVSNWDTSNVTTMRAMFVECNKLKSLNLDNWDLTNVTNLNSFVSGCHVLNTTITIRGTNCTNYAGEEGYWAIFFNAATNGNIIVNYTADASSLVDEMIATKSDYSKVYKGAEVV